MRTHTLYACLSFVVLVSLSVVGGCDKPGTGDTTTDRLEPIFASHSDPRLAAPHKTALWFVDGTRASGIDFRHDPGRTDEKYMMEIMTAGVVVADFNRDGAPDVVLTNSGSPLAQERPAHAANRLYLNDGTGKFHDATEAWALPSKGYGVGGTAGDYDGDGWIDLLLTHWNSPPMLLRNTGTSFVDVTKQAGLDRDRRWSSSAGFFDMDNDGDLDLYVARYIDYTIEGAVRCYQGEHHGYCTPVLYDGVADSLYRNQGDGTFEDVSDKAGFPSRPANGLALMIGDVNGDHVMDVFVANDITPNFLLLGNGDGTFNEVGQAAGVAYSEQGSEEASMGADLIDVDADGLMDLVCTNFQGETTSVYRQRKANFFGEEADALGVGSTARARLSFGIKGFDADNDGDEDLIMANGHIQDTVIYWSADVEFEQPNTLYEAENGAFVDVTQNAGPALQDRQVSRGLATLDIDSDGDLDFIVANNGGTAQVVINESRHLGAFVSFWLEGTQSNRDAIGAVVTVRAGDRSVSRALLGATSYLSRSDSRVHVGLGAVDTIDDVTIRWPSGHVDVLSDIEPGAFYRVVEGGAVTPYVPGAAVIAPQ